MYQFWLGDILLPISPEKITVDTKSHNRCEFMVDGSEINLVEGPRLRLFKFDVLIPYSEYPFSNYLYGFVEGDVIKNKIEELKNNKTVFQFVITRIRGKEVHQYTDHKCVIEEISIIESAQNGFDIVMSLTLREYKEFGAKFINNDGTKTQIRQEDNAPKAENQSYSVKSGDSLWSIAKKFYNDGSKWKTIYNANTSVISNPNVIKTGMVITIPKEAI